MAMKKVIIEWEVPESITQIFHSQKELSEDAKKAFIMELLRQEKISQSRAVELLGITRSKLFDLMAEYEVPATKLSEQELHEEMINLHTLLHK